MTWFLAVLVVAAIGGVAVVAAGYGAPMSTEYDDRPDVRVQADRPLSAADLREVRFTTALRGYRASEVDALLARLGRELEPPASAQEPPPSELPDWSAPGRRDAPGPSGPAAPADRE